MTVEHPPLPADQQCCLEVLEMVRVLHERGYGFIRIAPGMSSSGMSWRCAVTHRGNIQAGHGALAVAFDTDTAHYTSAAGTRYFGWDDAADDGPGQLADKFLARFPGIAARGRGSDPDYARWYLEMLALARRGAFPVAYADWYSEPDPRLLPTIGDADTGLPMPPGGTGRGGR